MTQSEAQRRIRRLSLYTPDRAYREAATMIREAQDIETAANLFACFVLYMSATPDEQKQMRAHMQDLPKP